MSKLGAPIDPETTEPMRGDFEPLAPGWYAGWITSEELKAVAGKPHNRLQLFVIELIEQYHEDLGARQVWERLNVINDNDTAQKIGWGRLGAIMRAVGEPANDDLDTAILLRRPFAFKLKIVPVVMEPDGVTVKYKPKNEITEYDSLEARVGSLQTSQDVALAAKLTPPAAAPQTVAAPAASVAATSAAAPAAGKPAPWKK